jgi:hypothetical protein
MERKRWLGPWQQRFRPPVPGRSDWYWRRLYYDPTTEEVRQVRVFLPVIRLPWPPTDEPHGTVWSRRPQGMTREEWKMRGA